MPDISTRLTGLNNWRLVEEGNVRAIIYKEKNQIKHVPIPHVHIRKILTTTAYAIAVGTVTNKKPTWKYGGLAVVKFHSEILGEDVATITQKKLFLENINIVIVPKVGEFFEITLYPPHWFWDYQYIVWEYVGNSPPDIYSKIDSLANNLP
ncbi:MAG: hypothetical protein QXV73_05655 [Candidatus Micrarchaeia archaeon]